MQDDIKRLFAYSSISQMGYLLFGIYSATGLAGADDVRNASWERDYFYDSWNSLIVNVGSRSLSKLGGLAGKMPITAVCAVLGAMTIMGVPPTSGFMGEWIVFYGAARDCLEEGHRSSHGNLLSAC